MGTTHTSHVHGSTPSPSQPPPPGEFNVSFSPELVARLTGRKVKAGEQTQEELPLEYKQALQQSERTRERLVEEETTDYLLDRMKGISLNSATPYERKEIPCKNERDACLECIEKDPTRCEELLGAYKACVMKAAA